MYDPSSSDYRLEFRPQPPIPTEYRPELRPQPPIPAPSPPQLLSPPQGQPQILIVDFTTDSLDKVQRMISHAATTAGYCLLRNLPMHLSFLSVQRVFDKLYSSPIAQQQRPSQPHQSPLNQAGHGQGQGQGLGRFFNMEGKWAGDPGVDNKASLALNTKKLSTPLAQRIKTRLGPDFEHITSFFSRVENELVPLILQATSDAIPTVSEQQDLWSVHKQGNSNLRLIDYHRSPDGPGQGAREHKDGSTATIIFQDHAGGLEVQDCRTGEWICVPGGETVVMWGRAGEFFSGGRVKAVKHRVRNTFEMRRNSAVVFVGPDHEAKLNPLVGEGGGAGIGVRGYDVDGGREMTVGDVRELVRLRREEKREMMRLNMMNQGEGGRRHQQEGYPGVHHIGHDGREEHHGVYQGSPQGNMEGSQSRDTDWSQWGPGNWRGGGMGRGMGRGRGRGMSRGGLEQRIIRGMGRRVGRGLMNQIQ